MFLKTKKPEAAVPVNASATPNKKGVPSVISTDLHILGNLISDGLIDIDGSVEGNVKGDQVTVRPNGRVSGDVVAECVHIYGTVYGLIRAQAVHLYSSCHVEGVIIHQSLSVEDGAFIDAKFKRQDKSLYTQGDEATSSEDDTDGFLESMPSLSGNLRLIS